MRPKGPTFFIEVYLIQHAVQTWFHLLLSRKLRTECVLGSVISSVKGIERIVCVFFYDVSTSWVHFTGFAFCSMILKRVRFVLQLGQR